ncbi:MAG: hypothetical protein WAZ18_06465 [Alphaproteobacteria bacterium]
MNFILGFILGMGLTASVCLYLKENHFFEQDDYWNNIGPNGEEPVYCPVGRCLENI